MQRLLSSVRLLAVGAVAAAMLFAWTPPTEAQDPGPAGPLRYDIADAVEDIVEELADGSIAGQQVLESLDAPTRDTISRMLSGEDFRYVGFSTRTTIEALYNLAEAQQPGEGDRFLAKLHGRVASISGAVDLDPGLQAISRRFASEELTRDLAFADPRVLGGTRLLKPLPTNVQEAVDILCQAVAPEEFSRVVELVERHFRFADAPRQVINSAIMQAPNRREALGLMIRAHGPPPPLQAATRALLLDVAATSAAVATDERVLRTLEELTDQRLPEGLRRYVDVSGALPSRLAQGGAAPGGAAISRPLTESAARAGTRAVLTARGVEGLRRGSADGVGPSYEDTRSAHADYSRRVHSGTNAVPRRYSGAIRSSRAARGVAVGGRMETPTTPVEGAFWLTSRENHDFGRIAVKLRGRDRLVATRHLFADSFEAAVALLWDDHGPEAAFREGEIVILVSMDPDSTIGRERVTEISTDAERRFQALARAAASATHIGEMLELYAQATALEVETAEKLAEVPRGVIVHPALHGRELAWSAVRTDFWFNDLERLSREGAMVNGGRAMPSHVREALPGAAGTWQFYERDGRIAVSASAGPADALGVRSRSATGDYTAATHFAATLFAFDEARPTATAERDSQEGVWRLVDEERAVQPLLDWAFANHHDFVRLNDFSAAFAILRWIDRADQQLVILDPDGAPAVVATPDRVFIGEVGPHAGERR